MIINLPAKSKEKLEDATVGTTDLGIPTSIRIFQNYRNSHLIQQLDIPSHLLPLTHPISYLMSDIMVDVRYN